MPRLIHSRISITVNLECEAILGVGTPYVIVSGAVVFIYTDIHNVD